MKENFCPVAPRTVETHRPSGESTDRTQSSHGRLTLTPSHAGPQLTLQFPIGWNIEDTDEFLRANPALLALANRHGAYWTFRNPQPTLVIPFTPTLSEEGNQKQNDTPITGRAAAHAPPSPLPHAA